MNRAWVYALAGVGVYVTVAIVVGIVLANNDMARPIIGGILWPLRLAKILLGGG